MSSKQHIARGYSSSDYQTINAQLLLAKSLPEPDPKADKDGCGSVLIIAGSPELMGACILSGIGALRAGAGRLRIATVETIAPFIGMSLLEARVFSLPQTANGGISPDEKTCELLCELASKMDCVLFGTGLSDEFAVKQILSKLLENLKQGTLVLDAAALNVLSKLKSTQHSPDLSVILTPHHNEMASLLECEPDVIANDPIKAVKQAVQRYQATVALKGHETFITGPDGIIYRNTAGNVGLATSGSGDTLAGVIAGLASTGAKADIATIWGVHVHATAGDRLADQFHQTGFLARELLDEIPHAIQHFKNKNKKETYLHKSNNDDK
ncbi:unnamed protein product [Didymodactylos carnosus]|uniref:ATP-dependent (S)-NAD(P)H-hydrate dehydratase n=1 Tax=Didymodactylos carnosus TaxID=1234261 RepID=A0A815DGW5_9BILA|nr:unnamed protein product [Didymodactylos carnosus]CAF1297146.1 unnamed protein product [Didymodactylos carnosus]CAF3970284.1 unnamed protein product [Didymodactylos carnosus]CAF4113724.1 unnamed protein product [Didymodactylos carnosus]